MINIAVTNVVKQVLKWFEYFKRMHEDKLKTFSKLMNWKRMGVPVEVDLGESIRIIATRSKKVYLKVTG